VSSVVEMYLLRIVLVVVLVVVAGAVMYAYPPS
jgi:hypothetical protein